MNSKQYFVYIATNKTNTVLYTGVTNNLIRRIYQHKNKIFNHINEAIKREKQIKAGSRAKKLKLIQATNPDFKDFYKEIIQ